MNLIRFYLLQYLYPANFLTWKTDMTTRLIQSLNDISSSSHHLPLYSSRPDRGTKKKEEIIARKAILRFYQVLSYISPFTHLEFPFPDIFRHSIELDEMLFFLDRLLLPSKLDEFGRITRSKSKISIESDQTKPSARRIGLRSGEKCRRTNKRIESALHFIILVVRLPELHFSRSLSAFLRNSCILQILFIFY